MSVVRLPLVAAPPLWRAAQSLGVVLTLVLLGAFVLMPDVSLHLLWDMVIPLLPAVFLVNPMIWRNVCESGFRTAWMALITLVTFVRFGQVDKV